LFCFEEDTEVKYRRFRKEGAGVEYKIREQEGEW